MDEMIQDNMCGNQASEGKEEALKLSNQLCFPLYAAARKITGLYTPLLKPLGLTYTQYIVFMVLWEKDNITVNEIGAKLMLDNGTLTPLLKKMESAGYITRQRSREDERKVLICLTQKGRDMKKEVTNIPGQVGKCVTLPKDQAMELYRLLYEVIDMEIEGDLIPSVGEKKE